MCEWAPLVFLCLVCGTDKMPKAKCSDSSRLIGFVQELGEKCFSTDRKILFYKVCEISVMAAKRFCVHQHCERAKHHKNLHLQSMKQNKQKLLFENPETLTSSKTSQFHRDLCEMLHLRKHPAEQSKQQAVHQFHRKIHELSLPYERTIYPPVMKTL
jgi:hypothetical protein